MSRLLARLRSAFAPPATTPDVELLSRFIQLNDQDAFAEPGGGVVPAANANLPPPAEKK